MNKTNQKDLHTLSSTRPAGLEHAGSCAVLFDMDGVLVDVSDSYRMAIKKTAEYFLREEISLAEIQEVKNRGGYNNDWDLTEAILLSRGKKIIMEQIIDRFQKYYLGEKFDGLVQNEKWLLDRQILVQLKQRYKMGIVTGRPREEADYVLRRFGLDTEFDTVVTLEDTPVPLRKPHPHGIKLALRNLAVARAVYVGDTIDDMKAAFAAGIAAIGVAQHKKDVKALKEHGAQVVVKSVNDILELLQ